MTNRLRRRPPAARPDRAWRSSATVLAALVLLLVGTRRPASRPRCASTLPALASLSQNIPLQAGAAVRGSAPAFDALAESRAQLEQVLARIDAGGARDRASAASPTGRCSSSRPQAVLDGRAGRTRGAARRGRRARDHAAAGGRRGQRAAGERPDQRDRPRPPPGAFRTARPAVEQDLSALADGTVPVEAATRRVSDSLGYMGAGRRRPGRTAGPLGVPAAPAAAAQAVQMLGAVYQQPARPGAAQSSRSATSSNECRPRATRWPRAAPRCMRACQAAGQGAGSARPAGSRARGCRCCSCRLRRSRWRWPPCCIARSPRCAGRPTCKRGRTSATRRRSCGCSTNSRASPTAT